MAHWRFPDVHAIVLSWLASAYPQAKAGTQTPPDFTGLLPYVRVVRRGGANDRLSDFPTVEIDVFDATYEAAEDLAERIRQDLIGPPPAPPRLDNCSCPDGVKERPWGESTQVRRLGATYRMSTRRILAAG